MCWFSIAKYLLFAFNFILWAAGVAVLGVGIWLAVDAENLITIEGVTFYNSASYILIASGAIAFIIGFLGCCGAMKESTCLLGLYFTCLLVVFILQVGAAIWALVEYDDIDTAVADGMAIYDLDDPEQAKNFETMQESLHCCGNDKGCEDWLNTDSASIPQSCECTDTDKSYCSSSDKAFDGTCADASYTNVYNRNCTEAMTNFIEDNTNIIIGIGLGIGLSEILGMIFSMCMCQAIKNKQGYA